MPIRKKGNIKVKTSPNRYGIEQTGYTFYSYDKNSAALVFTFIDSDNAPVNLSKADVQLLLISDNGDEFPVDKDDIDVISAVRGTARYVIPENLLGYEGKITGHIYLDFEDGSHTDEGQFTFNIKRSMISNVLPEAGDKYVQDFEDVKERVEQAGDSATKDIEKAKDDAESQIGDYAGEVESAKDNAVEDIDKALPKIEDKLEDIRGKVSEVDISDTNLLKGTSDKWDKVTVNAFGIDLFDNTYLYLSDLKISAGDTLTLSALFDNTVDDKQNEMYINFIALDDTNTLLKRELGNKIQTRSIGKSTSTITVPEGTTKLRAYAYRGDREGSKTFGVCKKKLQRGKYATDWTPNPSEVITKKEYDKLAQAITNLGGSL
ncbi:hypothetical protein TEHN7126_2377 [Tetragenococcus halophilus subsp. halophilus]|uniref:BppU family phage baseplate upper protein n=2 Tax=Tetragenococcus halophilus TaxID=51669 RepID=UPI000CC76572|nr:BppU family phage baseplate upper protein [Tetragenococcus halophilus]GBD76678.1 hypothetical protein TEHN7126_2377 [Tetragenococcus halophilus subsp. halophilus]